MDIATSNPLLFDCIRRYPALKDCAQAIDQAYRVILDSFKTDHNLFTCGNGGSTCDAEHISSELLKSFARPRPLSKDWTEKLGSDLAHNLEGALPAIPLTAFNSLNTAFANDRNADYTFAQLVWALGRKGDSILCISTSGNSQNVLHAAKVAQAKSIKVIGLTGKTGGELKEFTDICICVPETTVYKIQELHLPVYHTLCLMLEETCFPA